MPESKWVSAAFAAAGVIALASTVYYLTRADSTEIAATIETPEDAAQVCAKIQSDPWRLFHPAWKVEDAAHRRHLASLAADPQGRIESQFKVPSYLREQVEFWMLIHAYYGKHSRLLHHRDRVGLIYGHIDLSVLNRYCPEEERTARKMEKLESKIVSELKRRMTAALRHEAAGDLSPEELETVRQFLSGHGVLTARELPKLVRRIRTQTGQREEFASALARAQELLPYVESAMQRHGLPLALSRLPYVESSFNTQARSRLGAFGMWQFMPDTARLWLGARKRTSWDDPLRQTDGAVKVLRHLRGEMPDWSTAITAYNSGLGRMRRLVRRHGATDIRPLIAASEWYGLGFAGKNFYAQFLSANLVHSYRDVLFPKSLEASQIASSDAPRDDRKPAGN